MNMNEYFQQITNEWNQKIDELVNKTRKEVNDDLGNIEEEIALIEQGLLRRRGPQHDQT